MVALSPDFGISNLNLMLQVSVVRSSRLLTNVRRFRRLNSTFEAVTIHVVRNPAGGTSESGILSCCPTRKLPGMGEPIRKLPVYHSFTISGSRESTARSEIQKLARRSG